MQVFEVDRSYPNSLHDKHNDYAFLPDQPNDNLIPNLSDKDIIYKTSSTYYSLYNMVLSLMRFIKY